MAKLLTAKRLPLYGKVMDSVTWCVSLENILLSLELRIFLPEYSMSYFTKTIAIIL